MGFEGAEIFKYFKGSDGQSQPSCWRDGAKEGEEEEEFLVFNFEFLVGGGRRMFFRGLQLVEWRVTGRS